MKIKTRTGESSLRELRMKKGIRRGRYIIQQRYSWALISKKEMLSKKYRIGSIYQNPTPAGYENYIVVKIELIKKDEYYEGQGRKLWLIRESSEA